jgi:hypothetical protein
MIISPATVLRASAAVATGAAEDSSTDKSPFEARLSSDYKAQTFQLCLQQSTVCGRLTGTRG